jgi:hypothetical protein
VNATEQIIYGIVGNLPTAHVFDVAAAGFYSYTVNSAAVATTGTDRVHHGYSLQGRISTNASNALILDWGAVATDQVHLGDNSFITRVRGSDIRIQTSAGADRVQFLGATMNFNATVGDFDYDINHNGQNIFGLDAAAGVRNIAIFGPASTNFQTGNRVIFLTNAITAPTGNPVGGGYLYSNAGAGTWRGTGGTITAFGPA